MRIEMDGLKKPEDDHDSSVLNPEQSFDADLSRKERRLREREKIRGMGFKKKLEYIWMYYKPAMAAVLLLIIGVKPAINWYHNLRTDTVLSVSAINSVIMDGEPIADKIKTVLGCEDDKYSAVNIASNLTANVGATEFDYYTQMAYSTQIQARGIDVLIFPESVYKIANSSGCFDNLEVLLDEETKVALGDRLKGDYIAFGTETYLDEDFELRYQPVCIAVPTSAKNTENAIKWIASLAKE